MLHLYSRQNITDLDLSSGNEIDILSSYDQTGISEILQSIDEEFIGLQDVKRSLQEISSFLFFNKIRELKGLATLNSGLHMSFTGSSGTGKSSVATKLALVLRNLGYLTKGHILCLTREDFVGQYVGHTAPKTKENLQRARGGILFIDKADQLYKPGNERDYGSEAIELLLQVMENQREDLILIFSGEKVQIDNFFHSNPGVSSRIGNHIDFKNYSIEDLMCISQSILHNKNRYVFENDALKILLFYIKQLIFFSNFANARTMQIFLNQLISYQAVRLQKLLSANGSLSYKSLITIKKEDFALFTSADFFNIIGTGNIQLFEELYSTY